MAIFQGTARNRFPGFDDPNSGLGSILERARKAASSFLEAVGGQTFRNTYVDDGSTPVPGYQTFNKSYANVREPLRRSQITQRAKTTVFIKKKQFDGLGNNYDTRFIDSSERLYLRAVKSLMQRKCDEIAFYESTINLESAVETAGFLAIDDVFDTYFDNFADVLNLGFGISNFVQDSGIVGSAAGALAALTGLPDNPDFNNTPGFDLMVEASSKFLSELYNLKKLNSQSKASTTTRWVIDPANADYTGLGPGNGTIELNLVTTVRTSGGVGTSSGQADISIEDPYRLMTITESDIEIAVRTVIGQQDGLQGLFATSGTLQLQAAQLLDRELNDSRRSRGVSEINFQFVDGHAVGEVVETAEQFTATTINQIGAAQHMNTPEFARAIQILSTLDSYRLAQTSSINAFQQTNVNFAPLRKRMREDFLGQHIVQPMDQMVIFINSNTLDATPTTGTSVDSQVFGIIARTQQDVEDSVSEDMLRQEHAAIAPSLPFTLYVTLRNRTIFRDDGNCVFSGPVQKTSDAYSAADGKFVVSISAADNTEYLKISRINMNPALANTFGIVNDPLTPFNIVADGASSFVTQDNQVSLTEQNRRRLPMLRLTEGPNAGSLIKQEDELYTDVSKKTGEAAIRILQHVPGLLYQWKQGIISASLNFNGGPQLGGQGGREFGQGGGTSVAEEPFANMDIANIVSILTTGQPYNYSSFLRSVSLTGNFSANSSNNSSFFFNYLFDFLERNARFYGNFIPAKDRAIDPGQIVALFDVQKSVTGLNSQFASLRSQIADVRTKIALVNSQKTDPIVGSANADLQRSLGSLQNQADQLAARIESTQSALPSNIQFAIEGNTTFSQIDQASVSATNEDIAYRLKRKPEDVRHNRDQNFLIVSSKYDTDLNIQAFVFDQIRSQGNLFSADFDSSFDIISRAVAPLGLEFFANPDGNLVLRPPQYNRMPLSLMSKLLAMNNGDGAGLLPDFLVSLFNSRKATTESELFRTELELYKNILLTGQDRIASVAGSERTVVPLLRAAGNLLELDIALVVAEADAAIAGRNARALGSIMPLQNVFGPRAQLSLISQSSESVLPQELADVVSKHNPLIDKLKVVLRTQAITFKGTNPDDADLNNQAIAEFAAVNEGEDSTIKKNGIVQTIATLVSRRQLLIRAYTTILKQSSSNNATNSFNLVTSAGISGLLSTISPAANAQLVPVLPPFLADLIENDVTHMDGRASGKRHIIRDNVILSSNFTNSLPEFNQIKVTGQANLSGQNQAGEINGIPVNAAIATDFDSWRKYGFRSRNQDVHRPDFGAARSEDAVQTQCATYATFKLIEQRKKLHTGNITVIGNEFYRPGDVVYVNFKSMLFYVDSVEQDLDMNTGAYKTTLQLTHGRSLGEYIPTPLDVVGQSMLTQFGRVRNLQSRRSATPKTMNLVRLGTAICSNYGALDSINLISNLQQGTQPTSNRGIAGFIEDNFNTIRNAALRAQAKLAIGAFREADVTTLAEQDGRVEIRSYYAGGSVDAGQEKANALGQAVRQRFMELLAIPRPDLVVSRTIDLISELTSEQSRLLAFPTEEAWIAPYAAHTIAGQAIELPVNAVDIVYVVDRDKRNTISSTPESLGDLKTGATDAANIAKAVSDFEVI